MPRDAIRLSATYPLFAWGSVEGWEDVVDGE
jgi:hypothetical protein